MEPRPGRPRTGSATSASARGKKSCDRAVVGQAADSFPFGLEGMCEHFLQWGRDQAVRGQYRPRTAPGSSAASCDGAAARRTDDESKLVDNRTRHDMPAMGPRPDRPRSDGWATSDNRDYEGLRWVRGLAGREQLRSPVSGSV
jgi:hypothetical protein